MITTTTITTVLPEGKRDAYNRGRYYQVIYCVLSLIQVSLCLYRHVSLGPDISGEAIINNTMSTNTTPCEVVMILITPFSMLIMDASHQILEKYPRPTAILLHCYCYIYTANSNTNVEGQTMPECLRALHRGDELQKENDHEQIFHLKKYMRFC